MLRRSAAPILATAVPRHVWDPTHHNQRWVDSYAKPISDRRVWPSKVYSIGLEPQTPSDWLHFSLRNLAYAYNAALRECATFGRMVPLYQEMKRRGVKMDTDTMFIMLSRAARQDSMDPADVCSLFEEMKVLGAKPDLAVAEVLHTLLDHSLGCPAAWQMAQRSRLAEVYISLLEDDITTLGAKGGHDKLLLTQFQRYRVNVASLSQWKPCKNVTEAHNSDLASPLASSNSPSTTATTSASATLSACTVMTTAALRIPVDCYVRLIHQLQDVVDIAAAMVHYLTDAVQSAVRRGLLSPDKAAQVVAKVGPIAIPSFGLAAQRQSHDMGSPTDFADDQDANRLFVAALERTVDLDLPPMQERQAAQLISQISWQSGTLTTSDYQAQLFDIIKFHGRTIPDTVPNAKAPVMSVQEKDLFAMNMWGRAVRGGVRTVPRPWIIRSLHLDARVVGRYVASRDPWSPSRIELVSAAAAVQKPSPDGSGGKAAPSRPSFPPFDERHGRDAAGVDERWNDVTQFVRGRLTAIARAGPTTSSGVSKDDLSHFTVAGADEVFTGLALYLRGLVDGAPNSVPVAAAVFDKVQRLRNDLDGCVSSSQGAVAAGQLAAPLEPELECWEAMLVTLRHIMDVTTLQRGGLASGDAAGAAGGTEEGRKQTESLFRDAANLRAQLVDESRTRFNGKFKVLWLQEI